MMADAACLDFTVPSPPTMFVVDMPWCNYAMNMARMTMNIINSSSTIQIAPPSQHTFSHATLGTHLSRALKNARIRALMQDISSTLRYRILHAACYTLVDPCLQKGKEVGWPVYITLTCE